MTTEIRPYYSPEVLWGILNPYGQLWTDETFRDPADAWKYVADFWPVESDRSGYRVVLVSRAISVVLASSEPVDAPDPPRWAKAAQRIVKAGRRALSEAGDG